MKVLGIDPGIAILGWSILEKNGNRIQCLDFGVLESAAHTPLTERLCIIYNDLKELLEEHRPDVIALETLFFVKNAKTLALVGHARGVILLLAGQYKCEVQEYAPKQIKMALTGSGAAEKRQMQLMVQRMLNLKSIPQPDDAADAVAVGLCHLQFSRVNTKVSATI
ncbi:MAG: crossover junction endodeoxyribonuclease RuvC [Elusimicrobiota bacterium]